MELYCIQARVTHDWIAAASDDVLEWVPLDGEGLLFNDERSRMGILSHYNHIVVGNHVQAPKPATYDDGVELNAFGKDLAGRLRKTPAWLMPHAPCTKKIRCISPP